MQSIMLILLIILLLFLIDHDAWTLLWLWWWWWWSVWLSVCSWSMVMSTWLVSEVFELLGSKENCFPSWLCETGDEEAEAARIMSSSLTESILLLLRLSNPPSDFSMDGLDSWLLQWPSISNCSPSPSLDGLDMLTCPELGATEPCGDPLADAGGLAVGLATNNAAATAAAPRAKWPSLLLVLLLLLLFSLESLDLLLEEIVTWSSNLLLLLLLLLLLRVWLGCCSISIWRGGRREKKCGGWWRRDTRGGGDW